jgi:hypothetical protein|tara:strand:+ start:1126 stop:2463 length:1338 start_codon:yes stop_codon:yes gene_type:complete
MVQIESIKRVEIFPSNRAGNNVWSYRNGNPTLEFKFSKQDRYLLSSTCKLHFTLRLRTALNVAPNNNAQNGGAAVEVRTNCKIGAGCLFSNVTLSNNNNQTLEFVRNFPKLLSSLIPARANFEDYSTLLQQQFAATSNNEAEGMINNHDIEVCMPLLVGMFLQGDPIPLGNSGLGALSIRLQMSPSIEALYGLNAAGSYYEIVNPSLTAAMGNPPGGVLPPISSYPYLAYNAYYNVLNNGDVNHNIAMGLRSVLSVFSNFVPTSWIANNVEDGNATPNLRNAPYAVANDAVVQRYTTLKAGLKYPYQFAVDETSNITNVGGVQVANFEAQLARNFLSSISAPIKDLAQTLTGNISEATQAAPDLTGAAPLPLTKQNFNSQGYNVIGVGARYDQLGEGIGANFKDKTFSHRIQSTLDGVSPNSIYTFALSRNMVNFNDQGGISVSN